MKQEDLAAKLNCTRAAISHYESGYRDIDSGLIFRLCEIFGCTADYLLGRSSSPAPTITDEDAAHLIAYHAAPPEIRASVDTILAAYVPQAAKEKDA